MKKILIRTICVLLICLLLPVPKGNAGEIPDLTGMIRSGQRRHFVEAMLSYHLRENTAVKQTLEDGYTAVFFFEGCSDNMEDPELQDLSYYRVSAVCIALRLDENGEPEIVYFNDDCSTLPDRPLEFGAWELEDVGEVGPATVCDGTYELYSVYHAGSYEALHLRTTEEDETVDAVYLTPEGFVTSRATYINIHTRTGNHALEKAMWSAGCILVGDGDFRDFEELVAASYYGNYERFAVGQPVGTVTINRLNLQEELYGLYEDREAVETILVSSRCESPRIYMDRCGQIQPLEESRQVRALRDTQLMSLPCSNGTDARSIPMASLQKGDKVEICGSVVNTQGNVWYEVELFNENCYVYAGDMEEVPKGFFARFADWLLG